MTIYDESDNLDLTLGEQGYHNSGIPPFPIPVVDYEERYPEYFSRSKRSKKTAERRFHPWERSGFETGLTALVLKNALTRMRVLETREFIAKPELVKLADDMERMEVPLPNNYNQIPSPRLYRMLQGMKKVMQTRYDNLK